MNLPFSAPPHPVPFLPKRYSMKHDHRSFAAMRAYGDDTAERIRRFLPMVRRLAWHVHGRAIRASMSTIWSRPGWSR
jgi:hypothetical protein